MPIENLARNHLTPQQMQDANAALDVLLNIILSTTTNLSPEDRRKYGNVGKRNTLLINSVKDFHEQQPNLQAPEVDWTEFEKDYQDRSNAWQLLSKINNAQLMLTSFKILADYDNYTHALRDYQYAKYKSSIAGQPGYDIKVETLKQFFPKTGKTLKKKSDDK